MFVLGGADVAGGDECLAPGAPRGRGAVATGKGPFAFLRLFCGVLYRTDFRDKSSGTLYWGSGMINVGFEFSFRSDPQNICQKAFLSGSAGTGCRYASRSA
jgi:hypothetical protein